jgi:hypothetical protein
VTTDPSTLPQFKGHPVPWVTRWSHERSADRLNYGVQITKDGSFRLGYKDGKDVRDGTGMLWQREGIARGGEPEWAAVNTYRQRSSMRRCQCQVCGKKIDERPIRWLMPPDGIEQVDEDTLITMQPPTCSECIPLALELCPNLKKHGYQILKVLDYKPWGVYGDVVMMSEGGLRKFKSAVSYDTTMYGPEFRLSHVMAQQAVVQLGKFVVEERVEGKARLEIDEDFFKRQMEAVRARLEES